MESINKEVIIHESDLNKVIISSRLHSNRSMSQKEIDFYVTFFDPRNPELKYENSVPMKKHTHS